MSDNDRNYKMPVVSSRSTKKEIMEAYNTLLKNHKEQVSSVSDKKEEQKQKEEQQTLTKIAEFQKSDDVASSIHKVRTVINQSLDEAQFKMEDQFRTYTSLQDAIDIQKNKLKEVYDIEEAAYSLLALLKAREEQKKEFELEVEQEKQQRKREEEAYQYQLRRERIEEEEERRKERQRFEEEMNTREELIAQKEKMWQEKSSEFEQLKKQVELFPERLEAEKEKQREEIESQLTKEGETKILILRKDAEAQKSVFESRFENLNNMIENQKQQISNLQQQLQDALKQVQEITLKTIEGTSDGRALQAVNKIAMKQASSGNRHKYTDEGEND